MLHFFQERSSDYKERNKCFFLKIAPLALSVEARAALGMWTWSLSAMGKFSFTFSSAVPFSVEWEEYQKHRTLLGELSECLSEKWPKESLPCQHVVNTNAAVIIPPKALSAHHLCRCFPSLQEQQQENKHKTSKHGFRRNTQCNRSILYKDTTSQWHRSHCLAMFYLML